MSITDLSERHVLTRREAAEYLGISPAPLASAATRGGDYPPFIKLGARRVGYLRADLDAYLAARRVRTTAESPESRGDG